MNNINYIIWNPNNNINIYFFKIRFYSLIFFISFICGWYIMNFIYEKEKLDKKKLDQLMTYTIFSTIIGARLGHVFFYDFFYFKNHWIEAILPIRENFNNNFLGFFNGYEFTGYNGLSSHGATIGLIISNYIYSKKVIKKPFLWLYDRLCIPICLASSFIRIGNFFNSEIVGKPSKLPWAVKFINMSSEYGKVVPRHPAQLYESIIYFITFIILLYTYLKTKKNILLGYNFGIFFVIIWSARILIEFIKEPQGLEFITIKYLNTGQLLAIPFLLIGILSIIKSNK